MNTSKNIAAIAGPAMLAVVVSEFLNAGALSAFLAPPAAGSFFVIFLGGLLLFVAGLAIVRAQQNRWDAGWPGLVTLTGWLFLVGGLARLILPMGILGLDTSVFGHTLLVYAAMAVLGVLGLVLTLKGYSRAIGEERSLRRAA